MDQQGSRPDADVIDLDMLEGLPDLPEGVTPESLSGVPASEPASAALAPEGITLASLSSMPALAPAATSAQPVAAQQLSEQLPPATAASNHSLQAPGAALLAVGQVRLSCLLE